MPLDLSAITAPMVNQSDLPFRALTHAYGATITYTQMLQPERLINDLAYLEFHQRDLMLRPKEHHVVVQLCGNEAALLVEGARKIEHLCDGIDLNLGCPQEAARDGHYGAYLLGERDWPVVEEIVSALSHSVSIPTSAKLRICQPAQKTSVFSQRLEASGASWITLHPRTVSARRRRNGPADLSQVKVLKDTLHIPVITNGNVRTHSDIENNLQYTNADGIMIGEPLLANPCLFATDKVLNPVDISLEYLALCHQFPDTVLLSTIQTHVRHFVDYQWYAALQPFGTCIICDSGRRPWFSKFRSALTASQSIEEIEMLLRTKVERWRGQPTRRESDDAVHDDDLGMVALF